MSGWPDTLICMDTYADTLTSAVITAAETTHPGVWSRAPKRKPMTPHGRAQRIRALTDLITVAQSLLDAEMRDGKDFSKTAPDLSYTLMGQAAGMTRQAAHEAVTKASSARRKPLGRLALGSALLNTDEDAS
jgi:hypothetical protein